MGFELTPPISRNYSGFGRQALATSLFSPFIDRGERFLDLLRSLEMTGYVFVKAAFKVLYWIRGFVLRRILELKQKSSPVGVACL